MDPEKNTTNPREQKQLFSCIILATFVLSSAAAASYSDLPTRIRPIICSKRTSTAITMAKTMRFADGVEVPVPGFGAMGISFAFGNNLSYDEAEPVLLKALELGCTFWDTAVG